SGVAVGQQTIVEALAELDRDRHAAGCLHGRAHDAGQQLGLGRDRRATAAACDLGHRAAEVHVEVIDQTLADEALDREADVDWIDAVELQAAWRLVGSEAGELERLAITLDEW